MDEDGNYKQYTKSRHNEKSSSVYKHKFMNGKHINLLLGKVFNAFGRKPLYNPAKPSRSTIPTPWNTVNGNKRNKEKDIGAWNFISKRYFSIKIQSPGNASKNVL